MAEIATSTNEVDKCRCHLNVTCWVHHDCSDGSCTHQDVDDYYEYEPEEDYYE